MVKKNSASVLILAAGKSQRMGAPKFTLPYDENTSFVEHVIYEYRILGFTSIVLVLNPQGVELLKGRFSDLTQTVAVVQNDFPERGRFRSIKLGLQECNAEHAFIQNTDSPFIDSNLLQGIQDQLKSSDYCYPTCRGRGGHPVLITRRVIDSILSEELDDLNLKVYLEQFNRSVFETDDERVTFNINSYEDYVRIFAKGKVD